MFKKQAIKRPLDDKTSDEKKSKVFKPEEQTQATLRAPLKLILLGLDAAREANLHLHNKKGSFVFNKKDIIATVTFLSAFLTRDMDKWHCFRLKLWRSSWLMTSKMKVSL